ncbi:TIP41-like family-domain-containing protein [Pisolithus marmoratus]|nr:TIP41-like family-domain-containing protein [Pisolithus marmoratus]
MLIPKTVHTTFLFLNSHVPIRFYLCRDTVYEDELHDNGSSNLVVRIRVMPTCFFILARFTLRVDNVLFRIHDTRIYHSFLPIHH